ncbi:hypothetical protein CcCBS67573_g06366 [Chytriomyces confervae]|uniref:Protection of telomeres protein 1 n=1 Tax=Chytriomyces confervae TaxID=246404 RepID=A0A507F3W5_9FUNG|nr:hypothetical protein CcCBS67573_g06366 [Chytriomyces confervae]
MMGDDEYERMSRETKTTCIRDVRAGNRVALFAVVRDDSTRKRTKTGDSNLSLMLVDPSAESPIRSNCFARTATDLPETVLSGTVVKIEDARIQEFNGKPQAVIYAGTKMRFFDLSRGILEDSVDGQYATMLSEWFRKRTAEPAASSFLQPSRRNVLTISEIQENRVFFDLYAQVMHVIPGARDDRLILHVSDFTLAKTPPAISDDDEKALLYPVADRLLKVTIWDDFSIDPSALVRGNFVYFRNLQSQAQGNGAFDAVLHNERSERSIGGKWTLLDHTHVEAAKIRKRVEYLQINKNRNDDAITRTPMHVTKVSIKDILQTEQVPTRFRFEAKVVDHLPIRIEDFARVLCGYCDSSYGSDGKCSECHGSDTGSLGFMFSFLLGDDSGYDSFLPVVVSGTDAMSFLSFDPADFKRDVVALNKLRDALGSLFTIGGPGQPRVMDAKRTMFCVQSFRPEKDTVVRYKLIATELVWY